MLEAVDRGALIRFGLVVNRGQRGQRTFARGREQRFLAVDVVVERRLRDAGSAREVFHARAVVAALVEDLDRDVEQRRRVIGCPAAGTGGDGTRSPGRNRVHAGRRHSTTRNRPATNAASVRLALAAGFAPVAWKSEKALVWLT